jgi:hypothetical protein
MKVSRGSLVERKRDGVILQKRSVHPLRIREVVFEVLQNRLQQSFVGTSSQLKNSLK